MATNKNIVINVGLNNSPADHYETLRILDKHVYSGSYWISSQRTGIYKGHPEPTTVTQGETKYSQLQIHEALKYLCKVLTQDCIAYKYKGIGYIAQPDGFTGIAFNEDYFLTV
tara:strand:+ start:299 stop:637 length:339 start_codon:yes stop_codon:yes gene_type:complete